MKNVKLILNLLCFIVCVVFSEDICAQVDNSDFEEFRKTRSTIVQYEDANIKVEKIAKLRSQVMVFYTKAADSTNLYVLTKQFPFKRSEWLKDTVKLINSWGDTLTNKNLAIYSVVDKEIGYTVNVFCGEGKTYHKVIRSQNDLESPFQKIMDYNTGKILGLTQDVVTGQLVAYFRANAESLVGKENTKRKFLYSMTCDNYSYWRQPNYVLKHNVEDFDYYDFAKNVKSRNNENYAILSFKEDKTPYLMATDLSENMWGYPVKMSDKIKGHDHKVYIVDKMAYVVFYRKSDSNSLNDMYVWYGKVKELVEGCVLGRYINITSRNRFDNVPLDEAKMLNSLLNIDIVSRGKKVIAMISAKWEENRPVYIIKVEIEQKRIKSYLK